MSRSKILILIALFVLCSGAAPTFDPTYPPQFVGGVGVDGKLHALATDNNGNLSIMPSTGNLANQLVLTNTVMGYPDGGGNGSCYGSSGPALVGRLYAEVCNGAGNSGSPVVYVTWDGSSAVATGTVHGKALAVGQCYVVPLPATSDLNCAVTAAAVNVEIVERS